MASHARNRFSAAAGVLDPSATVLITRTDPTGATPTKGGDDVQGMRLREDQHPTHAD